MFKKITALAVICALIFAAVIPVSAADAETVVFKISSASASAGESFTANIELTQVPANGISVAEFAIQYDKDIISINTVEMGEIARTQSDSADNEMFDYAVNADNGVINVSWITFGGANYHVKDTGVLMKLTGNVLSSAKGNSSAKINLVPIERETTPGSGVMNSEIVVGYLDDGFNSVQYNTTVNAGYIKVMGRGDVNKDGEIDEIDASIVLRHISLGEAIPENYNASAADATEDGKVDMSDVIYILNNMTVKGTSLDLSKSLLGGTYDSSTGSLNVTDELQFKLALPKTLAQGEQIKVYTKVKDEGDTGFRAYLTDGSDSNKSAIYTSSGLTAQSKPVTFTLTADASADYILFKGPTSWINMANVTFEYIRVEYLDSAAESSTETTTQTTVSETTTESTTTAPAGNDASHSFANGLDSSYYTISGNLSTSKGSVEYGGETISQCLKMESKTSITFTAANDGTLTMVFGSDGAGYTIYVDESSYEIPSSGILTVDLSAGAHTIKKNSGSSNLFYISYS